MQLIDSKGGLHPKCHKTSAQPLLTGFAKIMWAGSVPDTGCWDDTEQGDQKRTSLETVFHLLKGESFPGRVCRARREIPSCVGGAQMDLKTIYL